jgi:hypothetical protein
MRDRVRQARRAALFASEAPFLFDCSFFFLPFFRSCPLFSPSFLDTCKPMGTKFIRLDEPPFLQVSGGFSAVVLSLLSPFSPLVSLSFLLSVYMQENGDQVYKLDEPFFVRASRHLFLLASFLFFSFCLPCLYLFWICARRSDIKLIDLDNTLFLQVTNTMRCLLV